MDFKKFKNSGERRNALEKELKISLKNTGVFSLDESVASSRNCENMIGVCQIPAGVAGPIMLENKKYFIPLATTEGALVASVNRGCKAIFESGGAAVRVKKIGATRAPVFKIKDLGQGMVLEDFFKKNFANIKKIAENTDNHITLNKINTACAGRYFYARFVFDTDDAMGMNMATIASEEIAAFVRQKTGIKCLAVSGNYCVDKKPSWLNFTNGRGYMVWAEAFIKNNVLHNVLKTGAKDFYEIWLAKCAIGSALSGSMGFNAHFANIIAALFLATGQDPAHAVEGSLGITNAEIEDSGLYFSVYLPDLMLGTVGGGTGLATQKEALSIMGIDRGNGGKNALVFAKIAGAAVLAGEMSLLASLAQGSLAKAHKKLARGENL